MPGLWNRLRSNVRSWFRRLTGKPVEAGRWLDGHAFSWHGIVGFRPWVFPRRGYRLYIPAGWSKRTAAPLIALIHGCRQTPEEFARGTRIEAAANRAGVLVLMPDQKDHANPWRCWNWFDTRTAHGNGEAAIVAAMIDKVAREFAADRARIVVAGMSSGAALAAILGLRFPKLVRGAFVHSGIACGAAKSALTALTVMRRGPETDIAIIARAARRDAGDERRVPITIVQGTDDDTVARLNGEALARQYLAFNGVDVPDGASTTLPEPDRNDREMVGARSVRTREWRRDAQPLVRLVEVNDLAHAWSGGDDALPYNDRAPPDATAVLVDWAATLAR